MNAEQFPASGSRTRPVLPDARASITLLPEGPVRQDILMVDLRAHRALTVDLYSGALGIGSVRGGRGAATASGGSKSS